MILRWDIYEAGLIADCVRWVSPGEKAFGRSDEGTIADARKF